jgi:hypothetical protein
MKKMIIAFLIAVGCSCFATEEHTHARSCDSNLPFYLPINPKIAKVSNLHFIAEFPSSSGEFWFTNTTSKRVVSVLAVMELTDQQGQYMFNMLFHAFEFKAHRRDPSPSSPERQAQRVIQFDKPLLPGEKEIWSVSSPSFPANCPTSARASFLQIQYSDGSTVERSDPDGRREPVVLDASTIDLRTAPFPLPFEVLATLGIDGHGRPSVMDVGPASNDFKEWLGTRMEQWEFAPAYSGTTPVPGKLQILFRFHKDTPPHYPMMATLPDARVFETVDVFPPEPGGWRWRVYLGGAVVSIRGYK